MAFATEIRNLEAQRNKNIADARAVALKAQAEGRGLTAEEEATVGRFHEAIDKQDRSIEAYKRLDQADAQAPANGEERAAGRPALDERNAAPADPRARLATPQYRDAYREFLVTGERRAMTLADQASGGALLAPASVSDDIIRQADNLVFVAQKAKKYTVTSTQATGVRRKTARMSSAAWTTEIANIPAADSAMTFDRRDLTPYQLVKLALVSNRLLISGVAVESEITEELAYQFAIGKENAYLNGDGVNKPVGIFNTSASAAIASSRDVTSGTSGTFKAEDLIKLKYSIKPAYLNPKEASWTFHRNIVMAIRLMTDGQGRFIWREGLSADKPDTILDLPFDMSEYAPGTLGAGNYVAALCNWKYYGIAELKDISVQRLVELYAANGETGFKATGWVDGQPLLDEAFGRLKCAA